MYHPRIVDQLISDNMSVMGGVILQGARACGKTFTGLHHSVSSIRLDESPQRVDQAQSFPKQILTGDTPRLIDEWQLAPNVWNAARHEIDQRGKVGQFILSGSAVPAESVTHHSGAGRFARIHMRPMSLFESGKSTGDVSLGYLLGHHNTAEFDPVEPATADRDIAGRSGHSLNDIAEWICQGGWPALIGATPRAAELFVASYIDNVVSTAIPAATGVRHNSQQLRRLLHSLGRNVSADAKLVTLAQDVGGSGATVQTDTIRSYLDALATVFVTEMLPAWSPALRSKSRLRVQPKIHFCDPSIAAASLASTPSRLVNDFETLGLLFESLVVRDLRIYAAAHGGRVYHYRDNTGLEIDVVIELADGTWAGCEVKLGDSNITKAEANLVKLRDDRVDTARVGAPAFLAVITATEYVYQRPSGVVVIPLPTLRP